MFFDKETFGADRLVARPPSGEGRLGRGRRMLRGETWERFIAEAPLSEAAKRDLARLHEERRGLHARPASAEKKARLARMSYADFLTDVASVDPAVVALLPGAPPRRSTASASTPSPPRTPGASGFPGFQGHGPRSDPGPGHEPGRHPQPRGRGYFFHFPDGNASIARLLVRGLIPAAVPGRQPRTTWSPPAPTTRASTRPPRPCASGSTARSSGCAHAATEGPRPSR